MPQLKFYFNDSERKNLFKFVSKLDGNFIPDICFYKSDQYYIIKNADEFINFINQKHNVGFFVISNKFTFEPLVLSQNRFLVEPAYSIDQRRGGPYINFSFYLGYAENVKIPYKYSLIDIYPKFIHFNSHEEYKATDELKEYYNEILKYIKSKCQYVKKDGKKYWVGNEVLEEIEKNY